MSDLSGMSQAWCMCCLCIAICQVTAYSQQVPKGTIHRKVVVQRHNFHITNINEAGPTQVGNGNFAYGFDVTGMQTFNDQFTTMSHWGWHSTPPPAGFTAVDFKRTGVITQDRTVPYDLPDPKQPALSQWLAANPHRFNLGRIGLWMKNDDGTTVTLNDIRDADQYFDLWTATALSTFNVHGKSVKVTTVADPQNDIIAFKVESPLIAAGRLGIFIDFPYASLEFSGNGSDYNKPQQHSTVMSAKGQNSVVFSRSLDSTLYDVTAGWNRNNIIEQENAHRFRFVPSGNGAAEYVFEFKQGNSNKAITSFATVKARAEKYWPSFWNTGGCMDLSESKDSRWKELERRIVLSQYLMKLNASGNYPAQETGLVNNSWYGRFHYEMIWWHGAHFALWNRWSLLNNHLPVYRDNLAAAKARAIEQGYSGSRYPKCTGPDGREWPHPIHAFLIWQQPHPIFFADLDFQAHPTKATLDKWLPITDAVADFLTSYAFHDSARGRYVLGPPIAFVPENNDYYKDQNPAFELGYWRYAIRTAQYLRQRAGLPEKPFWNKIFRELSPIPEQQGMYVQWENIDSMWVKFNFEHPALLGTYGMLPGDGVDTGVMKKTFHQVMNTWKFDACWGWDFPMMALTAARLGETGKAVDLLLHPSPKNGYDVHGFVGGGNPYPYLPTNGGLLYAAAFMAAGWTGDKNLPEPGFPKNSSWVVKWEGLHKAP